MADANLERFRQKVREYRLLVNRNQSDLASYLNLDYNELSNRLNSNKSSRLSHDTVRAIVRALADWNAITTQLQAEELLDLMLCPHFDLVDLQARPLSKLSPSPITAPKIGQYPVETPVVKMTGPNSPPELLTSRPEISHNLPQQFSSFIGRQHQIAELKKLLDQEKVRLVSLIGAGGCGKTRLSLQVAAELLVNFRDGVWFVELASLSDPGLIAQKVATTLGLSEQAGRPILDTLGDYLRSRQLLLVLDNCEHLVEECARLVDRLLHNCPGLQILSSSREPFGMSGEISYLVPSLTLPDLHEMLVEVNKLTGYEAVRLFKERAEAVSPHFSLSEHNARTVVQLCRQLDGIPLAIELAAVRIRVLTVEQIVSRLDDRFRLLTGGSRTALPRQQTLRALVDWSYELLSATEKGLLASLSVFAGGWTLTAAAQVVCGSDADLKEYEILDVLTGLVNKSLVQVDENKGNLEARYHFLETIRQYALEKLIEAGKEIEAREQHLAYFANLAREFYEKLIGHEQLETLRRLDKELENVRAAIDYALKADQAEAVFQLTGGIFYFWESRAYYSEMRRYMVEALALAGSDTKSRGIILCHTGFIYMRQGNFPAARVYYTEALALSKQIYDKELLAYLYTGLGSLAVHEGNYAEGQQFFEECVAVTEDMGRFFQAAALGNLGTAFLAQGKYQESLRLHNEGAVIAREVGNKWLLTFNLLLLSRTALLLEDYSGIHHYLDEDLNICEEIGYLSGKTNVLSILGIVWYHEDKFKEARQSFEESLILCLKGGLRTELWGALVGIAGLISKIWLKTRRLGLLEQVACLCGAVVTLQDVSILAWDQPFQTYYRQALEVAQSGLDEAIFCEAFAKGQALPIEEAIGYARQTLAGA